MHVVFKIMLKQWRLVRLHASLHKVFRNLIALVITSGETTWSYRELQVLRKLEHGRRHYKFFFINVEELVCQKMFIFNLLLLCYWVNFRHNTM